MKTYLRFFVVSLFFTLVITLPVHAQMAVTGAHSQIPSLSTLPEADAIVYFNTSRIINDAMPRLLPQKELKELRDGMDQLNALTGINLKSLELFVITMRFNKPTSDTEFPVPDAMLVTRGDFDAKALIGRAIKLSGAEVKEERIGEHTLFTMSLFGKSKSQSMSSLEAAFSEIAVTNLDASTIAIGNTKYIKAALEAADGHGRIKSEILASVLRDPNTLMSVTGSPVMAFAKSFGLKMVDNPDPNCMTRFGEYYLAFSMGLNDFSINGAMNADNPNTARMVKNLLSGLIQEGKELVPDKSAQSLFDQVKLSADGDEVKGEVVIPQEMADKFIREMLAPKPPSKTTATDGNTATKPRSKSRRSRRRT